MTAGSHYSSTTSSSSGSGSYHSRAPSLLPAHRGKGWGRGSHTRGGTSGGSRNEERSGMGFEPLGGSSDAGNNEQTIMCNCGMEAVQRTVQKGGPNKGRQFFTCSKPREDQCGFFEWADNVPSCYVRQSVGGTSGSRGRGRGRGRGGVKSTESLVDGSTTRRTRAPPTCSVCRQQGHTKRTCPQAKQLS